MTNTDALIETNLTTSQQALYTLPVWLQVYKAITPYTSVEPLAYSGEFNFASAGYTTPSQIQGVPLFTGVSGLTLNGNASLSGLVDVTGFSNLAKIIIDSSPGTSLSSVYGSVTGCPLVTFNVGTCRGFSGSMAALTTLKLVNAIVGNLAGALVPPIPGNNPLLTSFTFRSWSGFGYFQTTAQVGDLSLLTVLTTFSILSGDASVTAINYMLNRLLAAKNAGAPLVTVNLSGGTNAAPTGQGVTDKASLVSAGVSVTTN